MPEEAASVIRDVADPLRPYSAHPLQPDRERPFWVVHLFGRGPGGKLAAELHRILDTTAVDTRAEPLVVARDAAGQEAGRLFGVTPYSDGRITLLVIPPSPIQRAAPGRRVSTLEFAPLGGDVFAIGGTLVLDMRAFRALDVDRAASTVRYRDEHAAPGIDDRGDIVIVHVAGTGPLNQLHTDLLSILRRSS